MLNQRDDRFGWFECSDGSLVNLSSLFDSLLLIDRNTVCLVSGNSFRLGEDTKEFKEVFERAALKLAPYKSGVFAEISPNVYVNMYVFMKNIARVKTYRDNLVLISKNSVEFNIRLDNPEAAKRTLRMALSDFKRSYHKKGV